jgi:hypothetical protein
MLPKALRQSIDQYAEASGMPMHLLKPAFTRPRPAAHRPGGEGGNASSGLVTMIGLNGLLAAALLSSAILVGLATAALN